MVVVPSVGVTVITTTLSGGGVGVGIAWASTWGGAIGIRGSSGFSAARMVKYSGKETKEVVCRREGGWERM